MTVAAVFISNVPEGLFSSASMKKAGRTRGYVFGVWAAIAAASTVAAVLGYSELTGTRIRTTAAKLGRPHLAEALHQYAQRADEAKMGYLDFLDLVLSEELAVRDDCRFRQGLRLSKLPHHKTLEDYDFSF